jgi:predicted short-subunit dehydrogenase-like oxidoreductase (DUF2520 family)
MTDRRSTCAKRRRFRGSRKPVTLKTLSPTNPEGGAIGIAGAGRVARAIGRILHESGEPVAFVASRTPAHAAAAAAFIGPGVEAVSYGALSRAASRILICVCDSAIDSVARLLGEFRGVALHTCGAKGPEALAALRANGASCGVMHPFQTVADGPEGAAALRGIAFAVSGDEPAVAWAGQIAAAAGGRIIRVPGATLPLYHAAAVMASNYVVAVLGAAQELLVQAGVEPDEALLALGPMARQSVENTLRCGAAVALTGPIERGDASTVASHLCFLERAPEPIRGLYRAAGLQALEIARRRSLPPERAADIEKLLRGKTS